MFQIIMDEINSDITKLENSGISLADLEKYNYFKEQYASLKRALLAYANEMQLSGKNYDYDLPMNLKTQYAKLTVEFSCYLESIGNKKIYDYRVSKILEKIEELLAKLNRDNYRDISESLDEKLSFYSKIDKVLLEDDRIKNVLTLIHYRLLKYKIVDYEIDDICSFDLYLPFIVEDINKILDSSDIPSWLRDKLTLYLLDSKAIINDIEKVILLINIGLNNENLTEEEFLKLASKQYYRVSELQKRYVVPSKEIKNAIVQKVSHYKLDDILQKFQGDKTKSVTDELVYFMVIFINEHEVHFRIIEHARAYMRDLGEGLILNNAFSVLKNLRDKSVVDTSYFKDLDMAVIACLKDLSADEVAEYIILTQNEYLINYIIKSGNKAYFTNELIQWAINNNIPELVNFINDNNVFTVDVALAFKYEKIDEFLKRAIKKVLATKDINIISKFMDKIEYKIYFDVILLMINSINDNELKEQITAYAYQATDKYYGTFMQIIAEKIKLKGPSETLKNLNIFEAYLLSDNLDLIPSVSYILELVQTFYTSRLKWSKILSTMKPYNEVFVIYKYLYLGNKRLFFELVKVDKALALYITKEVPDSLSDFIDYLLPDEILNLPEESIHKCASALDKELKDKDITFNTYLIQALQDEKLFVRAMIYIINYGILDSKIICYLKGVAFKKEDGNNNCNNYTSMILEAIKKTKHSYLRPSLILFALDNLEVKENLIDWNIILMSDCEIEDLINNQDINSEAKNLRLSKYCGDLLKLFDKVSYQTQISIINTILKLGNPEYLKFIITKYPIFKEFILASISDDLYQELAGATRDLIPFDGNPRS